MRIVHQVLSGDVAGGQLVALRLARAARDAGHDVCFTSPTDGPFIELVRGEGFIAEVIGIGGALDARAAFRLARTYRAMRVDIVHTHAHFSVNTVSRIAGRLAGARVLAHMHIENVFRADAGRLVQIAVDNATARLCFAIVAVSESTRLTLLRQGYPRVPLEHRLQRDRDARSPCSRSASPTVRRSSRWRVSRRSRGSAC